MMIIKFLLATILSFLCFLSSLGALSARELTVVSWGGAYANSQVEAYHKPFIEKTGVKINSEDYNGGIAEIKAQVEAGNVIWDIVDVELSDAIRACDEGLLETIDHSALPAGADGTPAIEDFIEGSLYDCAVGNTVWSTIFAYDSSKIADGPKTMADFFDLEKFPGKRGLRKGPKVNLEFALIADGVPATEVYDVLDTPEGVDRAFAKLDTIKDQVVWWEAGAQPPQLLADGEVAMTTAYNGRIFNAIAGEGLPFEIVWDGQVWDLDLWVIPKGAKNKDNALEFLKFSTSAEQLAAQASFISYGPARKSSAPLVGKYHNADIDMGPQMPTAPANLSNAVQSNFEFWADSGDSLTDRFNNWLAGVETSYSIDTCQSGETCSVMPVFFGTNRNQTDGGNRIRFENEDGRSLKLGIATVTIPKGRKRGQKIDDAVSWSEWATRNLANIFNTKQKEDPTKFFSIPDQGVIVFSNQEKFLNSIKEYRNINRFHNDHSFVFIHGFNTSFDEAAFRTAQLAYDLGLSGSSFGVPFFFSWPSAGSTEEYFADYDNARYAEDELNEFLKLVVDKTGSKYVHVVSHSMGNYLFLEMLVDPQYDWGRKRKLNEVVLAAPDIDAARFVELSPLLADKAEKFTLYASNMDSALGWSKFLRRGKPRAGDVQSGLPVITNETETIDVSVLGYESFRPFSGAHSNYAETLDLIDDIAAIFQHRHHPPHNRKRSFIPMPQDHGMFWRLEQ